MKEDTKQQVVKVASYIAVTFALGLGARVVLKTMWKVSKAIDKSVGYNQ